MKGRFNIFLRFPITVAVTTLFLFISSASFSQKILVTRERVYAKEGVINLENEQWSDYVFGLYGKWDFYWGELLTPEQLANYNGEKIAVDVPGSWTSYKVDGKPLPKFGYATYHIKVTLPPNIHDIGLSFHGVFTAYKLWVNGQFIDENGKVGTSKKDSKPTWVPKTYYLHLDGNEADIVIQVSNYQHFKAGLVRQVVIGAPELIEKFDILNVGIEAGLIGSLLIFALFFLMVYYYRKDDLGAI